ncbi:MAG: S-methyl-5-thioribose-1-phosphate isomerase [Nanoarchaeota archaeon]
MRVNGIPHRTIWEKDSTIQVIDQRHLPHDFVIEDLNTFNDAIIAIKDMHIRGAPLIGIAAAYGMYLAAKEGIELKKAAELLKATRPTAINLAWAVDEQLRIAKHDPRLLRKNAAKLADEDVAMCKRIGEHGLAIIKEIADKKGRADIMTHCNAGWLATVDRGTATAPIYLAKERGIDVHVWVSETRPRNQGMFLTAWELGQEGISHHIIPDNASGHLMQKGKVDLVLTGADRIAANGDAVNKIGTYMKAVAAKDNDVPFYVCAPSSTFDLSLSSGKDIPIEERGQEEVTHMTGRDQGGKARTVLISPERSRAKNFGFDITPFRLITGLITDRGICGASEKDILLLFKENVLRSL